jgi:hypothetical protein
MEGKSQLTVMSVGHVGGCGWGGIIDGSGGDYLDAGRIGIQLKAAIFTLHSIVAVLLVFHHRQVPIRSSRFRRNQHDTFRVARRNDRVDLRILVMNSPRFKRRLVVHFTDDVAVSLEFYDQKREISHLFTQKNDQLNHFLPVCGVESSRQQKTLAAAVMKGRLMKWRLVDDDRDSASRRACCSTAADAWTCLCLLLLLLFSVHKGNKRQKTAKSDRDTQEMFDLLQNLP